MLSKIQADAVAENILTNARKAEVAKGLVLSRSNRALVMLCIVPFILLPQFMNHWFRKTTVTPVVFDILMACLCVCLLLLLVVMVYQKTTPIVKIDDENLTYFGNFPWNKKKFALLGITLVTLTPNPISWRRAHRLTIEVNGVEHSLWLPSTRPSRFPQMRKMFANTFEGRYIELFV